MALFFSFLSFLLFFSLLPSPLLLVFVSFLLPFFFLSFFSLSLSFSDYRPYFITIALLYGVNKVVQLFWGLMPMRTTSVDLLGDSVVRVSFPKHKLAQCLNMYDVAQYAFINFPGLSLFQWHPFTLASSPREDVSTIYVKAIGDYTRSLIEHAAKHDRLWIRVDGPYGGTRVGRFPNVVFVCGGIGATPVMSILKDIYDIDVPDDLVLTSVPDQRPSVAPQSSWEQTTDPDTGITYFFNTVTLEAQWEQPPGYHSTESHAARARHLRQVYLIWTVRSEEQYRWFARELDLAVRRSAEPNYPDLHLR
mgnify:CR=1 FL=1